MGHNSIKHVCHCSTGADEDQTSARAHNTYYCSGRRQLPKPVGMPAKGSRDKSALLSTLGRGHIIHDFFRRCQHGGWYLTWIGAFFSGFRSVGLTATSARVFMLAWSVHYSARRSEHNLLPGDRSASGVGTGNATATAGCTGNTQGVLL